MTGSETIVVVGAGVLGLTAALRIQEAAPPSQSVVIVARDFPKDTSTNYATPWAGAHYRPVPGQSPQLLQEAAWAKTTYKTFERIAAEDPNAAGVLFMPGEELFEAPPPEYLEVANNVTQTNYAHLSRDFSTYTSDEIHYVSVKLGFRYWTYCVNTPVYAEYLLRKFVYRGGRFKKYTLAALEEAFALEPNASAVVNCSGMGFGDPKSFIIRGQTCLVRNPIHKTITRQNADGSWSFAIPRPLEGGTIIGGTKQPNDWNPYPLPEIRQTLLSNAAKWFPFAEDEPRTFEVIRDIVGRRPARHGGLRLEAERKTIVSPDGSTRIGKVVHAYGIGGRGVELSWGIADDVVAMLRNQSVLGERARL